jgi:FixJ family two-component response regulator
MQGFHFSTPLPAAEMDALLREGRRLAPPRGAEEDFRRTLLLVDDEENILSALARLLRRDGYRILRANSGEEGLGLLATHEVGVIVSDQRMPGMNGVDFLRRAKDLYPDTIRIVLSGYTELNAVTEAINEGAVYKFLTKPWEDEQLRAHILEAFQRHELKRENALLTQQLTAANQELYEAKGKLEQRVAEKSLEATRSLGALEVSQEMLESLPVGVLGVDEEGMIAVANHLADRLFGVATGEPLVGALAAERLPAALTGSVARVLQGNGPAHGTWRDGGRETEYWCHAMGLASLSRGATLVVAPFKEE